MSVIYIKYVKRIRKKMSETYQNKDWLFDQYWNQGKSERKIAGESDVDRGTIRWFMKKFNILKRTKSEANKGQIPWNTGKTRSIETKQKISEANSNEKHGGWKGNNVGYVGLHEWIRKNKPKPELCEICGKPGRLELSNITGKLLREVDNFQYVHKSCHKKYDKFNNIKHEGR